LRAVTDPCPWHTVGGRCPIADPHNTRTCSLIRPYNKLLLSPPARTSFAWSAGNIMLLVSGQSTYGHGQRVGHLMSSSRNTEKRTSLWTGCGSLQAARICSQVMYYVAKMMLEIIKYRFLPFLTTREAAWYIISVMYVCQTITFESLDVGSSYLKLHVRCISRNTGEVRI